jgi:hypothetical protein
MCHERGACGRGSEGRGMLGFLNGVSRSLVLLCGWEGWVLFCIGNWGFGIDAELAALVHVMARV